MATAPPFCANSVFERIGQGILMRENRLQPNLDPHVLARELSNRLLIDGTLRPALSGRRFAVINPATGETIAEAAEGAAAAVAIAVDAATRAQKIWAKTASREPGRRTAECGPPPNPQSHGPAPL